MEKANPDSLLPSPNDFLRAGAQELLAGLPPLPADPGRAEALLCIKPVRERLQAWRDDAQMRLERSLPGEEPRLRNLRDNYRYLDELLLQATLALGGEA